MYRVLRVFRNPWLLVCLTVLVQVIGVLTMRWQILSMFNPQRILAPTRALYTSYAVVATIGILGSVTALAAIYQLLKRARWAVVFALGAFPCLPSLFLSLFYLYGLLLFEGVV